MFDSKKRVSRPNRKNTSGRIITYQVLACIAGIFLLVIAFLNYLDMNVGTAILMLFCGIVLLVAADGIGGEQ